MSTTKHHTAGPSTITNLEQARERRAQSLLDRRDELGQRWAEALSHNLPNAEDLAHEIALVEQGIGQSHPSWFDALFGEWVVRDASKLHEPGALPGSCPLCGIARGGVA